MRLRPNLLVPPQLQSAHGVRRVTWFELFFDLVFVVVVSRIAGELAKDYSLAGLLKFALLFLPTWWAWIGQTFYLTRFDSDDIVHRGLTMVQMFLVATMAQAVPNALTSQTATFAMAYMGIRLILVAEYIRVGLVHPATRGLTFRYAAGFTIAALLWPISLLFPQPAMFIVWAIALAIDFATPSTAGSAGVRFAPHVHHLPERFGLFTIIIMGESILAVVAGLDGRMTPLSIGTAALGWMVAFGTWWAYFDGIHGADARTVTAQTSRPFKVWLYIHLPLTAGIVIAAIGIKKCISTPAGELLPLEKSAILVLASALVMTCMNVIFRTTPVMVCTDAIRRLLFAHGLVTALTPAAILLGIWWHPIAVVAGLAVAWLAHVLLSLREGTEIFRAEHVHQDPESSAEAVG